MTVDLLFCALAFFQAPTLWRGIMFSYVAELLRKLLDGSSFEHSHDFRGDVLLLVST